MKLALSLVILLAVVLCIAGSLRKALTVATGYGIYIFLGQLYDYVLWPIVQGYHGMTGAVAMSLGAVVINFGVLHAYQRMGIDWLGTGAKGWGIFAGSSILQGTRVFTLTGERTDYDTICELVDSGRLRNDDPLHISEDHFLVLDSLSNLFNHCCDPNLGVRSEGELFALRDILPGEELCYDYSTTVTPGWTSADWSMEWRCGSAMCRKILGDVLTLPAGRLEFYQQAGALTDHVLHHLPPSA